jgi:hypothetical protein
MAGDWGEEDWGTFDWGVGGSLLPVSANPLLTAPSLCFLIEIANQTSLPLNLTTDLSAPTLKFSTRDLYPGGTFAGAFFEKRCPRPPEISLQEADAFGGRIELQQFTVFLYLRQIESTQVIDFRPWLGTTEPRGWLVYVHGYDVRTDTLEPNIAIGKISAVAHDDLTLSLLCTAFDPSRVSDKFPAYLINVNDHPYAPVGGAPSGGLGSPVTHGWGVMRNMPGRYARARNDADSSTVIGFTVDAAGNTCTAFAHGLQPAQGPFHVQSSGALPGGLATGTDYWVILVNEDVFQLASSFANATIGAPIDFLDAGTGTFTLVGGLLPNLIDWYDFVILHGNLSVEGVRVGGLPLTQGDYSVEKRAYRQGGRYETAIRLLQEPRDDSGSIQPVAVDGQRVLADIDDAVISEWDWQRGLGDDISGADAVPYAGFSADTSNLVVGPSGWGLGAIRCKQNRLMTAKGGPDRFALDILCIEFWFRPTQAATSYVLVGPRSATERSPGLAYGWYVEWQGTISRLLCNCEFASDPFSHKLKTTGNVQTSSGGVTLQQWTHVMVSIYGGHMALQINGTTVDTDFVSNRPFVAYARDSSRAHDANEASHHGVNLSLAGSAADATDIPHQFTGDLGPVRISGRSRIEQTSYARRATNLMKRNFVTCLRDAYEAIGVVPDDTSWNQAETDAAAIEQGGLHCDGAPTEQIALDGESGLPDLFRVFRGLRFTLTSLGTLAVEVDGAVTTADAAFSVGAPWRNIVKVGSVQRASIPEAVSQLRVLFRPIRDAAGQLINYQLVTATDDVVGVGQLLQEVSSYLIHDPLTADIVRSYRKKRLRTDDGQVELDLGHEGRLLRPGSLAQVALRDGTDVDYRVRRITRQAATASIALTPYDANDYVYDPLPLPADPSSPPGPVVAPLSLSAFASTGGLSVTLNVTIGSTTRQVMAEMSTDVPWAPFPTLVGGSSHVAVIDDPEPPDDDVSYCEGDLLAYGLTGRFAGPTPIVTLPVNNVRFSVRLRTTTTTGVALISAMVERPIGTGTWVRGALSNSTVDGRVFPGTTYATWSVDLPHRPDNNEPWTTAAVGALRMGLTPYPYVGGPFPSGPYVGRITQMTIIVSQQSTTTPRYFRELRVWRTGPFGSPATPAVPGEGDTPNIGTFPLLQVVDSPVPSSPAFYYYTIRAYDVYGRTIGAVLNKEVHVT